MEAVLKAEILCCFGSVSLLIETGSYTYQEGSPLAKRAKDHP